MRLKPGLILLIFPVASHALGLPDSGQTLCDNGSNVFESCSTANTGDSAVYPRQDGRFGLDALSATTSGHKVGGGMAGFDYTKIANDGSVLGTGAPLGSNPGDWACTRDNITGLIWEVKTTGGTGLRDVGWFYSWFSNMIGTNGGSIGSAGGGTCKDSGRCDTQTFVGDVNLNGLCGQKDWRLPSIRELQTLVHAGASGTSIDTDYFPNTASSRYWTDATYANTPGNAWFVLFSSGADGGNTETYSKSTSYSVRLVRGAPF